MAFNIVGLLVGRAVAESAGVDRQRATQLGTVFASGLINVPMPVGLVLARSVAQREVAASPAPATPGTPPGQTLVTIPNVVGLPIQGDEGIKGAATTLAEAGFTNIKRVEAFSEANQVGQVIQQEPPAGSQIPANGLITLYVGLGPGVEVPDLRTMAVADAVAILEELQLAHEIQPAVSLGVRPGFVAVQEPEDGAIVQKGDTVTLGVPEGDVEGEVI